MANKSRVQQRGAPIEPTSQNHEHESEQLGFERLVFFSDAVYAIAITLLVIDLRLPEGFGELDSAELRRLLVSMWPQYMSYVLSFLVIGSFWRNHHHKFQFIARYNSTLITLNMLSLMVIVFIPFPTGVLGQSGNATATILYACTIIAASLLSALVWWYSQRRHLMRPETSPHELRINTVRPLITALVFAISIPIAFVDAFWAKIFWAVLAPIGLWLR